MRAENEKPAWSRSFQKRDSRPSCHSSPVAPLSQFQKHFKGIVTSTVTGTISDADVDSEKKWHQGGDSDIDSFKWKRQKQWQSVTIRKWQLHIVSNDVITTFSM